PRKPRRRQGEGVSLFHSPPSRPWLSLPHVSLSLTAAKAARRARLSSLRSVADSGEVLLFSAEKVLV
ncbi:hypothetical protein S245_020751, partial [Arachis hypogaea]